MGVCERCSTMNFNVVLAFCLFIVMLFDSCINLSSARPTLKTVTTDKRSSFELSTEEKIFVYRYLMKYEYIDAWDPYIHMDSMSSGIKAFQSYTGLTASGEVDVDTFMLMNKPRCGNRDPYLRINFNHAKRQYTPFHFKWTFTNGSSRALTWKLESAARGLSFQRTLDIIRSAFKKWEKAVNINFFEVNKYDADIIVKFTTGQHTDPYPFDGQGGNVAHSFFPFPGYDIGGDIHIDNDEDFKKETDLMWVATHQIGHSLGLMHSGLQSAIMWPWNARKIGADIDLTQDDIMGIQSLYGPHPADKKTVTPSPTTFVETPAPPDVTEPSTAVTAPPVTNETAVTGTVPLDPTEPATNSTVPPYTSETAPTGTVPPDTNETAATGKISLDLTEPATTGTFSPDISETAPTGTVPPDTAETAATGTIQADTTSAKSDP